MGINCADIQVLIKLRKSGYVKDNASIIEIGAQQLSNDLLQSPSLIEEVAKSFNIKETLSLAPVASDKTDNIPNNHLSAYAPLARKFWKWLNFSYAAIDIDESEDSIPLDLNYDSIPESSKGKYDIVTNYGTTEHVANQLNAFKVIHELTKNGGIMIHSLPAQGMMNHGLVNYNFKFFWMLARSNGYKWIFSDYSQAESTEGLPQNVLDMILPYNESIMELNKRCTVTDSGLYVVVQKQFDTPYVPPLDVPTGALTSNKELQQRYWSVFNQNAFENLTPIKRPLLTRVASRLQRMKSAVFAK